MRLAGKQLPAEIATCAALKTVFVRKAVETDFMPGACSRCARNTSKSNDSGSLVELCP